MENLAKSLERKFRETDLKFSKKPILIGGMAMEYYGLRKSGRDIDLLICNEDYQKLAKQLPDLRKDIYGDLGIVVGDFEIWRSMALLDYDFYLKDAIDQDSVFVISLDRLLYTRVIAQEVEKYQEDLELIKAYYYETYRNQAFLHEAESHIPSYEKNGGIVCAGEYEDTIN